MHEVTSYCEFEFLSLRQLAQGCVFSPANKPSNSSDFSFELRTPDRQSWPIVLRKARFSPKLWTPSIRYGFRNSNVWSDLRTSLERGSAASPRTSGSV